MMSLLIVQPMKSYSSPIDQVAYSFLMHFILSINDGLYPISIVFYMYNITIEVLS